MKLGDYCYFILFRSFDLFMWQNTETLLELKWTLLYELEFPIKRLIKRLEQLRYIGVRPRLSTELIPRPV